MNNPFTEDEKNRLFMTLDKQTEQLKRLELGMYGDAELGQPGLIKNMAYVLRWISEQKLKVAFISGICVAVGFAIKAVWEYITARK